MKRKKKQRKQPKRNKKHSLMFFNCDYMCGSQTTKT